METVGIRELKVHLSDYLRKARAGESVVITDRGVQVAVLRPLSPEFRYALQLVEEGRAEWSGGKPAVTAPTTKIKGPPLSETILGDRR